MKVTFTTNPQVMTDADTIVIGLRPGDAPKGLPEEISMLVRSGEARGSFKSLAVGHANRRRWLLVGLGDRSELTAERVRVAAALAHGRAQEISALRLCWQAPLDGEGAPDADLVAAVVEGTILADYRFDRFKSSKPANDSQQPEPPKHLEALLVSCPVTEADAERMSRAVAQAKIVAEAVNDARDLQNRPGNDLTPTMLAEHARALAKEIDGLTVEVEGRQGILARGMGAFAAVAQGSAQEPALITIRYEPSGDAGDEPSGDAVDSGAEQGGADQSGHKDAGD